VATRFVLPEQESESVAFVYSPVVEAVLSLHVLVAPKHHPLQHAWVRRMRKLDPRLRAEIQAFRFAYVGHFPDFLCEAGLSKHLRLLARAGVLESRRDGYYVLYSLVPDRLLALSATQLAFIRPTR
jgi:hypothetical protein